MEYALIVLSILTVQSICFKKFNHSFMKNFANYFIFNFLYCIIVILIFSILNSRPHGISNLTVILAVSFGVLFIVATFSYMKAMENGPLSYASLMYLFGILIPIVFGMILWDSVG